MISWQNARCDRVLVLQVADCPPTDRQRRSRAALDREVAEVFEDSGRTARTYGSSRVYADLIEAGWKVSEKTVTQSMSLGGSPEASIQGPHHRALESKDGWL